jgi:inner membrane protein
MAAWHDPKTLSLDTLTHALSGALAAHAASKPTREAQHRRVLTTLAAAAFPDVDYLLYWLSPIAFLGLHRGPTHSLVLLPVWAYLLSRLFAALTTPRGGWRSLYPFCALGLAAHVTGDVFTVFGTRVLYPLSDATASLGWVFDIDGYLLIIAVLGSVATLVTGRRSAAVATLALFGGYLLLAAGLKQVAHGIALRSLQPSSAASTDPTNDSPRAVPGLFSPLHWTLVLSFPDHRSVAYLDLLGGEATSQTASAAGWRRLLAGYRAPGALAWTDYSRLGGTPAERATADAVWHHPRFTFFRDFAELPALYRIDHGSAGTCVWFTDLRYALPNSPPYFRYGMCRQAAEDDWQVYRLDYFGTPAQRPPL